MATISMSNDSIYRYSNGVLYHFSYRILPIPISYRVFYENALQYMYANVSQWV